MKRTWLAMAVLFLLLGLVGSSSAQDQSLQYYQAGGTFYSQKNYDSAIRYYEVAAQMNPQMWQAYQGLGNSYYAKGDKSKALSSYQRCLDLHRDNPSLASFVQSLRDQMKVESKTPVKEYSEEEKKEILRETSGWTEQHFELNPAVGIALGGVGFGIGGGVSGFYFIDSNLGFGGIVRYFNFGSSLISTGYYVTQSHTQGTYTSTDNENDGSLEIVAALKYKFDGKGLIPYLTGGLGLTDISLGDSTKYSYQNGTPLSAYSTTPSSYSAFFPIIDGGGGLEFSAGENMNIFVEGRLDIVIGSGATATYIPIEGGLSFIM